MVKLNKYLLFLTISSVCVWDLYSQNIPSERITNWESPGSNEIFHLTQSISIAAFGADPNGLIASDDALSDAVNSLNGPGEIFIPKGTYLFERTIELPDSTVIVGEVDSLQNTPLTTFKLRPGNNSHGISITGGEINTGYKINYALQQGKQKLFVTDPDLFLAGDFIRLAPFDDSLLVTSSWALHSTGQIFEITDVQGDSLLLDKPLRRSYQGNNLPDIYKVQPRRQVHLKCIRIERLDSTTSQSSNIYFNSAVDCSVNGVESYDCNFAHIEILSSKRITVENSFFRDAHSYGSGGKGYGILLQSTTGDCFIHQNIFEHLRHSMILQSGANGNVVAYNYSKDPFWTGTSLPANSSGDLVLHGNYPYMNLFEGNLVQNLIIDNSHGINGPYNTFFRNKVVLYGIFMNTSPASNSQNFIGNQVTNTSSPILGLYVLQGINHFEYGNIVKGIIIPAGTSNPDDASMFEYEFDSFYQFVSSIPPFTSNWNSSLPLIEAHYRFEVTGQKAICSDNIYIATKIFEPNEEDNEEFPAYPNPFRNILFFSGKSDQHFVIFNALGQIVYSGKVVEGTSIDTDEFPAGNYFIQLHGNERIFGIVKF